MTLREDVKYIEKHLDQAQSVEQLRRLLAQKRLKLVVVLISKTPLVWSGISLKNKSVKFWILD